jgi:hypothetical protein
MAAVGGSVKLLSRDDGVLLVESEELLHAQYPMNQLVVLERIGAHAEIDMIVDFH